MRWQIAPRQERRKKHDFSTWNFNVFLPIWLQKASPENPWPSRGFFLGPKNRSRGASKICQFLAFFPGEPFSMVDRIFHDFGCVFGEFWLHFGLPWLHFGAIFVVFWVKFSRHICVLKLGTHLLQFWIPCGPISAPSASFLAIICRAGVESCDWGDQESSIDR